MVEIKAISDIEFNVINSEHPFQRKLLVKDYYLTLILYLIKDVEGIYFKDGTAINKILLNHPRLSEDIDFTLTKNEKEVRDEIKNLLQNHELFTEITEGKNVDGFIRMIVKCRSELGESEIFIDLNKKGELILPTEIQKISHFYSSFIPEFSVNIVAKEEIIAEKVAATIGRNKPRDHYDIYNLIHQKFPINLKIVKKKCEESGDEFSILKMFNKAKTLKNRWDKDMLALISEEISFQEVIKFLANHFNLKEEKEKQKSSDKK
jgi:predicted nucleotidyltransferase component of viral defense system